MGRFVAWQRETPRTRFQLAITLDGVLIGNCGVRGAEFGCELDPARWGAGYAREASRAILAFGLERVERIEARCNPANDRAVRLATALGFEEVEPGVYALTGSGFSS